MDSAGNWNYRTVRMWPEMLKRYLVTVTKTLSTMYALYAKDEKEARAHWEYKERMEPERISRDLAASDSDWFSEIREVGDLEQIDILDFDFLSES